MRGPPRPPKDGSYRAFRTTNASSAKLDGRFSRFFPDTAMSLVNIASSNENTYACSPVADDEGRIAVRGELVVALPMRHAGVRSLTLRYELVGAAGAPVVFVAGGISAHR
ncbi:homoserine O-succinyltransferase, partial [Xanthomonas sp. Kuri4-3]